MPQADQRPADLHVLRLTPYYYLPGRELTPRELQYEPIGGMQVQIAQTTAHVDHLGVRQTVLAPRRPGLPASMPVGRQGLLRLLRLPVAPIRTRSKGYLGLLASWGLSLLPWLLRARSRREFSLVHVHCSELPWTYIVAVIAAAVLRRPLVITTHCSALFTCEPETVVGRARISPARAAERIAVGRAAAAVVLTERLRRAYVARELAPTERVHVVPDSVDRATFRTSRPSPVRGGEVLYCGRFAPEKGWRDFVTAAWILQGLGVDACFGMCGDGNELARCRVMIGRLGLGDRIALYGHLEREAVADAIRRASCVVVPSLHEELGGTVLEALASGRPVIATTVGGLPDLVSEGETGLLVPPGRPPELAAAIARLLADPGMRSRLGRAGEREAAQFDAARVARDLVRVYDRVMGGVT